MNPFLLLQRITALPSAILKARIFSQTGIDTKDDEPPSKYLKLNGNEDEEEMPTDSAADLTTLSLLA